MPCAPHQVPLLVPQLVPWPPALQRTPDVSNRMTTTRVEHPAATPPHAPNVPHAPAWAVQQWPPAHGLAVPGATALQAKPVPAAQRRVAFEPMTAADLAAVADVEKTAYAHPWSERHFSDSLQSGYPAVLLLGEALPGEAVRALRADGRVLLGYLVAMPGVDEVHLLNITVAPEHQRQGWARFLLDGLVLWSRGQRAQWLWLEVRQGNVPARTLYERYGFAPVGLRRGYYPAGQLQREDAVVMSLNLVAAGLAATTEPPPATAATAAPENSR